MSELLDRLRAASGESGRASAESLASGDTVEVMAQRVRAGVRRRRITTAVAGGVAAASIAAAAVIAPTLITPPEVEVAPATRSILNTDGSLTVYDDGSISVVANNGRVVDIVPPEGSPLGIDPRTNATLCTVDPEALESGWHWQDERNTQRLVSFGSTNSVDGDDWRVISPEMFVEPERLHSLGFTVDVDPAIEDSVVIQHSMVEAYDGVPHFVRTSLTADAEVVARGTGASAADAASVLRSNVMEGNFSGFCAEEASAKELPEGLPLEVYLIADVWLTDRAGTGVLLGTHITHVTTATEEK